jgi:3-oxoacyl-[acyl-carrier protein] reductase
MKTIDFTGKTALVTGGTRGIGLAIAREFLTAGANLIVTGTRPSSAKSTLEELNSLKSGQVVEYIAVDFAKREDVEGFLDFLRSREKLEICVNNAGTNLIKAIEDISTEDVQRLHSVNLYAPFAILAAVMGKMKTAGWGRIVNIGSLWSKLSRKGRANYAASKYGLMGLTVTAALEGAPFNVLANMVSPGFVWTDLSKATLKPEEKVKIARRIPVGKFALPVDIANPVLFLCSEMNNYITGQNIIVDGGYICE